MSGYPGSKNGAGVYQSIINQMPEHEVYIEAFVGSGAIIKRKRPASSSIVIDADAGVSSYWSTLVKNGDVDPTSTTVIHGDARSLIPELLEFETRRVLIYADPPYVRSSRRSAKSIYRHEFSDEDHRDLASVLSMVKAFVILSGYRCDLYDELFQGWRRVDFRTATRGGPAVESIWCNFPEVKAPHDLRFVGENYRERERIKRKRYRWCARLAGMPELERRVLLSALLEILPAGIAMLDPASSGTPIGSPQPASPSAAVLATIAGNNGAAASSEVAMVQA